MTGKVLYMAPEVGLDQPYNFKCDVYGLSILLWEMVTLQKAYSRGNSPQQQQTITTSMIREHVWENGKRPDTTGLSSRALRLLFARGWTSDLKSRHSMKSFSDCLRKELVRARGDDKDESGLDHEKRRSTFVFRNKHGGGGGRSLGRGSSRELTKTTSKEEEKDS